MTPAIEAKLHECWNHGMTLAGTQLAINRAFGVRIEREAIRERFVEFAEEWMGQGREAA